MALLQVTLFRIVAVLLLLVAGGEVYACDVSDACVSSSTGGTAPNDGCDQPQGDNCLCCCHHIVPAMPILLTAGGIVVEDISPKPVASTNALPSPIDHPPQL